MYLITTGEDGILEFDGKSVKRTSHKPKTGSTSLSCSFNDLDSEYLVVFDGKKFEAFNVNFKSSIEVGLEVAYSRKPICLFKASKDRNNNI